MGPVLDGPGPKWTGTEWTDRTDRDRDCFGPGSVGRSWEIMKVGRSRSISDEMSGGPGPTDWTDWTELARNL